MIETKGLQILETLEKAGHTAYFVGGCVRDHLLHRPYNDIDIATSATPEIVESLFHKTIPTGKDYGTITVLIDEETFEVTTYRLESDYDGRRPKVVAYAQSLLEDLSRRDFTINAMAMDLRGQIIDPYGGMEDLEAGILKFVGNPLERIREDRLRILRYVRFACAYNLKMAHPELLALKPVNIQQLSSERIRVELNKILLSDQPKRGILLLEELGLLNQFMPELSRCKGFLQHHPAHSEDVFDHTLSVLEGTASILKLRLAALFHDLGKVETLTFDAEGCGHFYGHQKVSEELAKAIMTRLKYGNQLIQEVLILISQHMRIYENITRPAAKRLILAVGEDNLETFFDLQRADTSACSGDRDVFLRQISDMQTACNQILSEASVLKVSDLAINGNDLIALGLSGKAIGETLKMLLDLVLDEVIENNRDSLIKQVQKELADTMKL